MARSNSTMGSTTATKSNPAKSAAASSISKGAAAGIGIGCAIAGALIAACVVIIFMRRRERRRRPRRRTYSLQQKPTTAAHTDDTGPKHGVFAAAEQSLPQPLEDAAIGGEMSKLQTLIKNYVQSYYHTLPVKKGEGSPDLSVLGQKLSISVVSLESMLQSPKTRIAAIRYCIAWAIFSRIGLGGVVNASLLPAEVLDCLRSVWNDAAGSGELYQQASE